MMPLLLARFVRVFTMLLVLLWLWASVTRHEWLGAAVGLLMGWLFVSDYINAEGVAKK